MDVREARQDEMGQISATLADAFAHDPVLAWLIRGRMRRAKRLTRLFELEMTQTVFPRGRVLTTDGYRGASLELPPEQWGMPKAMPLGVALAWLRVFGMQLPDAIRTQVLMEEHHPPEPHYYIRYVGVLQEFQGQGIGAELLRPTLERSDQDDLPVYLEASSERSVRLYERLGFVHLGKLEPAGGSPLWRMRRPPGRPY